MRNARQKRVLVEPERGFTLIEVLISIMITMIVMAAVFGLLTRGQKSFRREPEVADLQQSARAALDMVTKDILQAGAGLPPEFPAFSRINGAGNGNPTDVIEIIGALQSAGNVSLEPEFVTGVDASGLVNLESPTSNLHDGDMVVLYNNVANDTPGRFPRWALARVANVDQVSNPTSAQITLDYGAYDSAYSELGGNSTPDPAEFVLASPVQVPKITRVSVVRYFTQLDNAALYNGPPPQVLMRQEPLKIPAQPPQAVGYLEDFQIAYVIGYTAPVEQDDPPDAVVDMPTVRLTADNMISSVRITVTARSVSAGLEGASAGTSAGQEDDFIRKTFSTNVNPRNLSAGLDMRALAAVAP
jgi:type II secretory pathway pseudopilin PulG